MGGADLVASESSGHTFNVFLHSSEQWGDSILWIGPTAISDSGTIMPVSQMTFVGETVDSVFGNTLDDGPLTLL